MTRRLRTTGGCGGLDNPTLDARRAHPRWLAAPASVLQISPHRGDTARTHFSLWALPGRKTLAHESERILLSIEQEGALWRLSLNGELGEGAPFDFVLPAGRHTVSLWPLASRLTSQLESRRRSKHCRRSRRPTRESLMHLRTLQALDGEAAGATHREIASAVFSADQVFQRWSPDSELRAQLRHLLRRGRRLVDGGYKRLLGMDAPVREGDFRAPAHPP